MVSLYGVTCAQIVRLIRDAAANGDSRALRYTVRGVYRWKWLLEEAPELLF